MSTINLKPSALGFQLANPFAGLSNTTTLSRRAKIMGTIPMDPHQMKRSRLVTLELYTKKSVGTRNSGVGDLLIYPIQVHLGPWYDEPRSGHL